MIPGPATEIPDDPVPDRETRNNRPLGRVRPCLLVEDAETRGGEQVRRRDIAPSGRWFRRPQSQRATRSGRECDFWPALFVVEREVRVPATGPEKKDCARKHVCGPRKMLAPRVARTLGWVVGRSVPEHPRPALAAACGHTCGSRAAGRVDFFFLPVVLPTNETRLRRPRRAAAVANRAPGRIPSTGSTIRTAVKDSGSRIDCHVHCALKNPPYSFSQSFKTWSRFAGVSPGGLVEDTTMSTL